MTHKGACHCGRVAFEADGTIEHALACNCSICRRRGSLLWFVGRDAFRLSTPEQNARVYTFNKHLIRHRFCPECGIHVYGEGIDPQGRPMVAVNIRCLEDVDPGGIPVTEFDGRAL